MNLSVFLRKTKPTAAAAIPPAAATIAIVVPELPFSSSTSSNPLSALWGWTFCGTFCGMFCGLLGWGFWATSNGTPRLALSP